MFTQFGDKDVAHNANQNAFRSLVVGQKSRHDKLCSANLIDDRELVQKVTENYGLEFVGQLTPTNLWMDEMHSDRNFYLHKCNGCPIYSKKTQQSSRKRHTNCSEAQKSAGCCQKFYLVFAASTQQVRITCCSRQPSVSEPHQFCTTSTLFFAVDPKIAAKDFDPTDHLVELQVEHNVNLAAFLSHDQCNAPCPRCLETLRFAGSGHTVQCSDCQGLAYSSLLRDALVRVGTNGNRYWQFKPLAQTDADRVYGQFGHSVFRGQGQKHYLPDHKRRIYPVSGGSYPSYTPRAISAARNPVLCDQSVCRSAL